jgi:hypothetical protein
VSVYPIGLAVAAYIYFARPELDPTFVAALIGAMSVQFGFMTWRIWSRP